MPIPLTGAQRILATAARRLVENRGAARAAELVRETYDYLTVAQAESAVRDAQAMRVEAEVVEGFNPEARLSDVLSVFREASATRVADVDVEWIGPDGKPQHRTVRVEYTLSDTVGSVKDKIDEAAAGIIDLEANIGSDTIGTAPPNGEYETKIVSLL